MMGIRCKLCKKKKKLKRNWCFSLLFSSHFHPSVQVATNDKRTCFFRTARFLTVLVAFRLFLLWLNCLARICFGYRGLEASLCVTISDPLKAVKLYQNTLKNRFISACKKCVRRGLVNLDILRRKVDLRQLDDKVPQTTSISVYFVIAICK